MLALVLVPVIFAMEENDVEFARPGGFALTLDAKTPDGNGPFPAVIIVHGGSFSRGNKRTYVTPLFELLSSAGFAWFTINYRLAPDHQFPAAVEDVESAVRWVRTNAAKYHVDARRIALAGESAGGYLVAYAAQAQRAMRGLRRWWISTVRMIWYCKPKRGAPSRQTRRNQARVCWSSWDSKRGGTRV